MLILLTIDHDFISDKPSIFWTFKPQRLNLSDFNTTDIWINCTDT